PKVVFYVVYLGNDLRNEAYPAFEAYKAEHHEEGANCPSPPSTPSLLVNRLIQFANMYLRKPQSRIICAMDELWPYLDNSLPPVQEGYKAIASSLKLLKDQVRSQGASLIVGIIEPFPVPYGENVFRENLQYSFPDTKEMDFNLHAPSATLGAILDELELSYVNFSEGFAKDTRQDHYLTSDLHLSATGHRSVSQQILDRFGESFQKAM
ncbi:MAG: hypothetical protein KDD60_03250, partial [Bdellovibrionales bacterium]|nr:hypothetical protein [Bdellovibrionales bacterium]